MKITGWNDEKVTFSDGSYVTYQHEQDCCEWNYADFSVLDIMYDGSEFKDYSVEPVKYGFNLVLMGVVYRRNKTWNPETKIYIPCYSDQNGYYANDVDVVVVGKERYVVANIEAEERVY